ncbi:MAG: DoxX family membrane protein [Chloroflexota bacterium]|nr:DoxX family membrane protein [Chloroflexota bacterium]
MKQAVSSFWKRIEPYILHKYTTLFSRIVLGGIFILAGQAKMFPLDRWLTESGLRNTLLWEINQYHILPESLAKAYATALPPVEIVVGILLILGLFLKFNATIGGLVTLSFTIAKIYAMAKGLDISVCPCFGPAVPLLSIYSFIIDIAMLLLVVQIFFHRDEFLALGPWIKSIIDRSKDSSSETTE